MGQADIFESAWFTTSKLTGLLTINFNPFPVLFNESLTLRQVSQLDVNEMFFLRFDERVLKYINRKPASTTEEAADFIKSYMIMKRVMKRITWAIAFKGEPNNRYFLLLE